MKIFKGILKIWEKVIIIHLIIKVVRLEETQKRMLELSKNDFEMLYRVDNDVTSLETQTFKTEEDIFNLKERVFKLEERAFDEEDEA